MQSLFHFPDINTAALGGDLRHKILHDALIECVETHRDGNSIGRRWSLGHPFNEARQATAHLPLRMGADPVGEGPQSSLLARAIL